MMRAWAVAALLAALVLVLLGRVIPLPPLVTGEEGVRTTLVSTQTAAVDARYRFQQARLNYEHYLATHDVPNLPNELRKEADEWDAGGSHPALLDMARSRVARMIELGQAMYPYAQAGDDFFATLRQYDDNLMSWSRTLGPRSEQLRRSTWPILAWLNEYPAPIGGNGHLALVPASATSPMIALIADLPPAAAGATPPSLPVSTTVGLLQHLAPKLDAPDASSAAMREIAFAGDDLWADGGNLPVISNFHDGYFSALRRYDADSLQVAATPDEPQAGRVRMLAWGGAVLVGVVLLLALLLVLAPPGFWRRLPPLPGRRLAGLVGRAS